MRGYEAVVIEGKRYDLYPEESERLERVMRAWYTLRVAGVLSESEGARVRGRIDRWLIRCVTKERGV